MKSVLRCADGGFRHSFGPAGERFDALGRAETILARIEELERKRDASAVLTEKLPELIRERLIDPASRGALSTDTEETSNQAQDQGGGDVTVASNLPEGDAGGGDSSTSQTSETRERVNYEVSQTEREITQGPGAIKRLSVAVLVNGTVATGADGAEEFQPRTEEELSALRELVASAVGFDEARGDVITLKTMQFEAVAPLGTAAEASVFDALNIDMMSVIQAAVLAIVALVLGLFVVRPVLSRPAAPPVAQLAPPAGSAGAGVDRCGRRLLPLTDPRA